MTASGSEAGIVGHGTVSETKSTLEQMRRSPQGTPKKPSRRRRVIGRGLLRHAVSSDGERQGSRMIMLRWNWMSLMLLRQKVRRHMRRLSPTWRSIMRDESF